MTSETLKARDGLLGQIISAAGRRIMPRAIAGGITITLPSGRQHRLGYEKPGLSCDLQLRNYKPLWAAFRRGAVGFAESYMAGDIDTGDLTALMRFYLQNRKALDEAARPLFHRSPADRLFHLLRPNTKAGARRNIHAHYDLGNAFYEQWLDPTMSYSSAYFGGGAKGLEAGQAAKYRLVLDALQLGRPSRILEIGCGWGGFAEAAAGAGHRVTGLTISEEQFAYARKRMGARAEIRFEDYRDTQDQFDAIASIEMIEAVGEANWPAYFRVLHDRLKPGGRAAVQAITISEAMYPRYRRKADFIQRYIFPGGMLPTQAILAEQAKRQGLGCAVHRTFGPDYARTLDMWHKRFEAAWPAIAKLGFGEAFRRRWRYYLCYCEAGFAEGSIDVGVYTFTRAP